MKHNETECFSLRAPDTSDGSVVWQLIRDAGSLDLNSPYSYIMLCDIFRDTCAVACSGTDIQGFMSGYRCPDKEDTLFVWQVAVSEKFRGRGIAKAMLQELLNRKGNEHIRYVEATIAPENIPSRRLFTGLAAEHGTECKVAEHYGKHLFPVGMNHEPELLFRIGPLRKRSHH
ncbi:diaminobutyrate acetyltransferase [Paenibacillus sp. FSL H8-0548]|uniref:diaminobutyrate acetyltransferase n=1 Tax=Paenibacillus sp. FSL H8-0548 TaxID=1920422 RepID=UPI00096D4A93|nr:diaminobutyrate acetyltransferase [Paenibacillus sp. FSL H8-0548]OMF22593.1 diaminobutyrate acetyltransferase [Paenibacillus sp. FSL H8-0548]